jgi:hypothetical protein
MNEIHQNEISGEIDWLLSRLAPLRNGNAVVIRLDNPMGVGKRKDPLITIVPGILFGFREKSVVVSVIGNGSCIIKTDEKKIANLVKAGIPARLASALAEKLYQLYER